MFNLCKSDNALAIFPASWPFEINPVQNRLAATEGFAHEETVAASGYGFYHDDTRVVRGMAVNICGQERQKLKTELFEHGCTPEGEHWWRIQTPASVFEHRTFMHNDCFHHSFAAGCQFTEARIGPCSQTENARHGIDLPNRPMWTRQTHFRRSNPRIGTWTCGDSD